MSESYRSGNSRMLAKTLDELGHPLALLDRRGVVVYANEPLCRMVKADSAQLVGQPCSWHIAADDAPLASILMALAPPASALHGKITARQLPKPIVFGSTETGQLFLPLLDDEGTVQATLVILGMWHEIQSQIPPAEGPSLGRRRSQETALLDIRNSWQTLDGLQALVGTSPAIELAMSRAQLAASESCNFFVGGPTGVGKTEVVNSIFMARLKKVGLPRTAGQCFPIACDVVEAELLEGMLDVFASRWRTAGPPASRLLVLEHFHQLSSDGLQLLQAWYAERSSECCLAVVSQLPPSELSSRGADWEKFMAKTTAIEIVLPPLRQRREDIAPLALQRLAATCHAKGRAPLALSQEVLQLLMAYPWPENQAQLAQAIDEAINHAVLVSAIQTNHLPLSIRTFASSTEQLAQTALQPIDLDQVLLEMESTMLRRALKLSPRNRAQAARLLGISRSRLLRRIEQLGLEDEQQVDAAEASD